MSEQRISNPLTNVDITLLASHDTSLDANGPGRKCLLRRVLRRERRHHPATTLPQGGCSCTCPSVPARHYFQNRPFMAKSAKLSNLDKSRLDELEKRVKELESAPVVVPPAQWFPVYVPFYPQPVPQWDWTYRPYYGPTYATSGYAQVTSGSLPAVGAITYSCSGTGLQSQC